MKAKAIKRALVLIYAVVGLSAGADLMEDFDSLGGNNILLEKAQALNPETQIEVVQERIVSRHSRHELFPELGYVLGGDAYLSTQYLGVNYNYHFNPRWSAGFRYGNYMNELSSEGEKLIEQFSYIPEMDWPRQSYMAVVNYYPMYGKFSVFGKGIVHFDFYLLAGYGHIELKSGGTGALTAGAGVGFWLSQHLTSRIEARYMSYTSQRFTGSADMELTVANFSVGYLL